MSQMSATLGVAITVELTPLYFIDMNEHDGKGN